MLNIFYGDMPEAIYNPMIYFRILIRMNGSQINFPER